MDFKLTPDIIQAISNAAKQGANQVAKALPSPEETAPAMAAANTEASAKKPSFLQGMLKTAGPVLAKVAPMALSAIPGVGPILGPLSKGLLSTLNDDEWFEEFKGNGAAFNQFLLLEQNIDDTDIGGVTRTIGTNVRTGIAEFTCKINDNQAFLDNFMPQVIADVRRETNNVLVDDTTQYSVAFLAAWRLLALYYTLEKYIAVSANQPLNLPQISGAIKQIAPANISQIIGITRSLKEYISSTIRLPYALTEYTRWRFGTTFHSDNTGKPALIMYNYLDAAMFSFSQVSYLTSVIEGLQQAYIGAGRAGADLKLTYDGHEQRLSVEIAHYDEKEFNLRTNLDIATAPAASRAIGNNRKELILDSRLDMNAALQAVVISSGIKTSTSTLDLSYAPIIVHGLHLHFYSSVNDPRIGLTVGWDKLAYSGMPTYTDLFLDNRGIYVRLSGSTTHWSWVPGTAPSLDTATNREMLERIIIPNLLSSAQIHNKATILNNTILVDGPAYIKSGATGYLTLDTTLSYDTAAITKEGLESIQRSAIRNLIRFAYKRKRVQEERKELATATSDFVKEVVKPV